MREERQPAGSGRTRDNLSEVDRFAYFLAQRAPSLAAMKGVELAKAFATLAQERLPLRDEYGRQALSMAEFVSTKSEPYISPNCSMELLKVRLKLEEELMRIDACLPLTRKLRDEPKTLASTPAENWPDQLAVDRLMSVVTSAVLLVGKRPPKDGWKRFERIDRCFPKLKICRRVNHLVSRLTQYVEGRPFAQLTPWVVKEHRDLAESFIEARLKISRGIRKPDSIKWSRFEPLLKMYRRGNGNSESKALEKMSKMSGKFDQEFWSYVLFLEIERDDLNWRLRYSPKLIPLMIWLEGLGNLELVKPLRIWSAESIDPVERARRACKARSEFARRFGAQARKRKSRLRKKSV